MRFQKSVYEKCVIFSQDVEGAEKCLSASTELTLFDEILDSHPALHRKEVLDKKNQDSFYRKAFSCKITE